VCATEHTEETAFEKGENWPTITEMYEFSRALKQVNMTLASPSHF
jgi:hypothetical protein